MGRKKRNGRTGPIRNGQNHMNWKAEKGTKSKKQAKRRRLNDDLSRLP